MKRWGSWITKLREVARFTIQTTSADHFSSSKGTAHSEEMKKRAQERILPSIFDVAQSYEDHITQYSLFEGTGNVDPGRGKHHTWKPIPRPARPQPAKRPRRTNRCSPESVREALYEASGEDTEPDDTMMASIRTPHFSQLASSPSPMTPLLPTAAHTAAVCVVPDENRQRLRKFDEAASVSGPCTPASPQADRKMYCALSTPNSSFDQSLHRLPIKEDLDMKPCARTLSAHGSMQTTFNGLPYGQPLQYPPMPPTFNGQAYPHNEDYPNPALSPFAQAAPSFINSFSMYTAPPAATGCDQYADPVHNAHAFSYDQSNVLLTPMGYPDMPMSMPITSL